MKILALTDIHGSYRQAEEIVKKENPNIVVVGGDLTNVGSMKEAEGAIKKFQSLSPLVLCVAGNMDLPQHDELFSSLGVSINGCGISQGDVGFFGVSAAPYSRLHTPYEISEEEILMRSKQGFQDVEQCRVKVFVPHAPPYGTRVDIIHLGIHVGSTAVREIIEEKQPDVVICGHIHEARGQDSLEKSKIVNCGPAVNGYYAVVEIHHSIEIRNHHFLN